MHPIEAEKQKQYKWWLDVFLPVKVRQGNRDERYRLGILVIAMLGVFLSGVILAVQSYDLPISAWGHWSSLFFPLVSVFVLIQVRRRGHFRNAALFFGLIASPLALIHIISLRTVYVGFFQWIPWLIAFVSFMAGRRKGIFITGLVVLETLLVIRLNGAYGHTAGAYQTFDRVFLMMLENHSFSLLSITLVMYTFALYNDQMESELERQHVMRAQTAHKAMIGEMLGNLAHEVNNPLAIVYTALIHYQRLLQSQRLDPSMQRGLIQRIGDALERLHRVVEDLNSSADWQDLELPRSFSLQSDQDRPPQFGNSRLMAGEVARRPERRRPDLWHRSLRYLINGLDQLLPSITHTWSTTQRFRARTTGLIYAIGMLSMFANLIQLYMEDAHGIVMATGYLFLAIGIAGIFLLKVIPRPQVLGTSYIMLLFSVTVAISCFKGQSILLPAIHWFPIMVAGLFLVARPRTALMLSGVILAANIWMMFHLRPYGLQTAFQQPFPQFLMRLHSTLILASVTTMVLAAAFISLMTSTHSLLTAEKDWHLLSARMRELSELADSAAILIGAPLEKLRERTKDLEKNGEDLAIITSMQALVERITRVSQSFALLSRPKINEGIQVIEGPIWMEHIHNICFRRAADAGWVLSMKVEPPSLLVQGPLGRLTMLVITALKEAFGHRAPQAESPLLMDTRADGSAILLNIRYAATPRSDAPPDPKKELEEAMRLSLLQELLDYLEATLVRRHEKNDIVLTIRWDQTSGKPSPLSRS